MKLIWINFYYFFDKLLTIFYIEIEDNTKVLKILENGFAQNADKHLVLLLISLTNFTV
jgi:hypothetical protein